MADKPLTRLVKFNKVECTRKNTIISLPEGKETQ